MFAASVRSALILSLLFFKVVSNVKSAVWAVHICFQPLFDAATVEDVLTGQLLYDITFGEIRDADATLFGGGPDFHAFYLLPVLIFDSFGTIVLRLALELPYLLVKILDLLVLVFYDFVIKNTFFLQVGQLLIG